MTNYYWSIYTELVISVLFSLQQMTKMTKLGPLGYTDTFGSGKVSSWRSRGNCYKLLYHTFSTYL